MGCNSSSPKTGPPSRIVMPLTPKRVFSVPPKLAAKPTPLASNRYQSSLRYQSEPDAIFFYASDSTHTIPDDHCSHRDDKCEPNEHHHHHSNHRHDDHHSNHQYDDHHHSSHQYDDHHHSSHQESSTDTGCGSYDAGASCDTGTSSASCD